MASGSGRFTSPENGRILDLSFFEVGVSSDLADKDRPTRDIRYNFTNDCLLVCS